MAHFSLSAAFYCTFPPIASTLSYYFTNCKLINLKPKITLLNKAAVHYAAHTQCTVPTCMSESLNGSNKC